MEIVSGAMSVAAENSTPAARRPKFAFWPKEPVVIPLAILTAHVVEAGRSATAAVNLITAADVPLSR